MLVAPAHLGVRVCLVAEVHLQHVVVHLDMQVLLWQSEKSRRALHVAFDAAGVGTAVHQNLTGTQQQVELAG